MFGIEPPQDGAIRSGTGIGTSSTNADPLDIRLPDRWSIGARLWIVAILLAAGGLAAFTMGIAAAFGDAGNWTNELAGSGILAMVGGAALNLYVAALGIYEMTHRRSGLTVWWLVSLIGVVITCYVGWMVIHL